MSNYVPPTAPMGQPPQYPGPPQQGYYQGQPPPQQPQPKSKTWMWVLGGCLSVVLLGVIAAAILGFWAYKKGEEFVNNPAAAIAKLAISQNPDVEFVSIDEKKGVIVVKEKKTGKQMTVNFEDAADGKFVFQEDGKDTVTIEARGERESGTVELKSGQGSVKIGAGADVETPGWLPAYPGATVKGNYSMKANDGDSGSFQFSTDDPIEKVIAFYEAELKAVGLTVNTTSWKASGAVVGGNVTGDERSNKRTVNVTLGADKGETQVTVIFATKP